MPFLKGVAGSGKSTIANVCKWLFDDVMVGTLSNNIEQKFGLSSLADKDVIICYEARHDMCLDQAELQSMISGENVQINTKFKQAKSVVWNTPMIMCGNELPAWVDKQGNMSRRVVNFAFGKKVQNSDPRLADKLKDEMPILAVKFNLAYRYAIDRYGKEKVWDNLPVYFREQSAKMQQSISAIHDFIAQMDLGEDKYMPYSVFCSEFQRFAMDKGLPRQNINEDLYGTPFADNEIRVENRRQTLVYPIGGEFERSEAKWIFGMTPVSNE